MEAATPYALPPAEGAKPPRFKVPDHFGLGIVETVHLYRDLSRLCAGDAARTKKLTRDLCQQDLFYLLTNMLGRIDMNNAWLFARCREVQLSPDGYLDLWAREHYKSTIITYGMTIMDILNNPEITIGIFSHTRDIAQDFLKTIKTTLQHNIKLKTHFDDILYARPSTQSPLWSDKEGILVKRAAVRNEATVEAWGIVDGMPTGRHFDIRLYDDLVTDKSVTNPNMIKKTTDQWAMSTNLGTQGGVERYAGTYYHLHDTYHAMQERGIKTRIYPATSDGSDDFRKSVLKSPAYLAEKKEKQGSYIFSCFAAGTKILRSDLLEQTIESIKPGDEVVGYTFGNHSRARLVRSKVLAVNKRLAYCVRFRFSSGNEVICTPDHKFWQGRADRGYAKLGFGKRDLSGACVIYDMSATDISAVPQYEAGYIAAFFDGEGSVSGNTIHFTQDGIKNADICARLEKALKVCGLQYSVNTPPGRPGIRDYYLTGGREIRHRFLRLVHECGKFPRALRLYYDLASRDIGKGNRDRLISIDEIGLRDVFNIQTETGNYVANGYAVKNCQMLLNPLADNVQGFKEEWKKTWPATHDANLNKVLLVDPSSGKRGKEGNRDNDYTSMWVVGLGGDGNWYVLDIVRDRLSLTQRAAMVMTLHRRWRPRFVGYEEYGLQADIEYIEIVQAQENYRFRVTPMGGNKLSKEDRIKRLVPLFENGHIYMPDSLVRVDYEGKSVNLTRVFWEEEYSKFPVLIHDDMLDALSRICDEEVSRLPAPTPREPGYDAILAYKRQQRKGRAVV